MESRVELFALIRRDARVEGLSVRALAARHGVHRRTVRQALESASPPERKPRQGLAWRLEPFKAAIDVMLTEDTTAPRKQRHTARRILARLIEEHGAEELSYSTVRDYVRVRGPRSMWRPAAGWRCLSHKNTPRARRRRWISVKSGWC